MINWLSEFEFLRPWWLALIPPSLFVVVWLANRRRLGGWHNTLSADKLKALTPTSLHSTQHLSTDKVDHAKISNTTSSTTRPDGQSRLPPMTWLIMSAITISLLALSGPTWQATNNPLASQRQAMVILFDLSPSMLAQDLRPNRLTRARLKVIDLLRARTEGETALIAYAGDAHRIAPLSDDPATVETLVQTLHPDIMPVAGSQTESAITLALDLFSGADLERGDILLVTDGLHPDAVQFIVDTLPTNFRLSVLGVGSTEGATIPVQPSGYLVDDTGNSIIARLDESSLQKLAQQLNGHYVRLRDDNSDVEGLLTLAGKAHDNTFFDSDLTTSSAQYDSKHDAGYWLVLLLLPVAALAFRRKALWIMLLWACIPPILAPIVFWPTTAQADWTKNWQWLWLNQNQQALQALREGNAERAAQMFTDHRWRAIALYENGNFDTAAQLMHNTIQGNSSNSTTSNHFVTHEDFYNLGNAFALSGQYKPALQAYEYALGLNPENNDARHNHAIVLPLVQQEEQNTDDEENQGGASNDDNNQQSETEEPGVNKEQEASGSYQQSGAAFGSGQSLDQSAITGDSVTNDQNLEQNNPEQDAQLDNTVSEETPVGLAQEKSKATPDELIGKKTDGSILNPYSEQWLQNLIDDPGGYLRRKLQYQAQLKLKQNNGVPPKLDKDRY